MKIETKVGNVKVTATYKTSGNVEKAKNELCKKLGGCINERTDCDVECNKKID